MVEIAKRYSLGLFELVKETNDFDVIREEILLLNDVLLENKEFINLFSSPTLTFSKKQELIDNTLFSFDRRITNLIKIVIKNSRAVFLTDILKSYISIDNQRLGILEGIVYSPFNIDSKTLKDIQDVISIKENKKVFLETKIDSTLIGGIKVIVNDHIYDGSVKNTILKMKQKLRED